MRGREGQSFDGAVAKAAAAAAAAAAAEAAETPENGFYGASEARYPS